MFLPSILYSRRRSLGLNQGETPWRGLRHGTVHARACVQRGQKTWRMRKIFGQRARICLTPLFALRSAERNAAGGACRRQPARDLRHKGRFSLHVVLPQYCTLLLAGTDGYRGELTNFHLRQQRGGDGRAGSEVMEQSR